MHPSGHSTKRGSLDDGIPSTRLTFVPLGARLPSAALPNDTGATVGDGIARRSTRQCLTTQWGEHFP